ncbi:uncharacterized protein LOC144363815 [Saccoglossus kowalevskii]
MKDKSNEHRRDIVYERVHTQEMDAIEGAENHESVQANQKQESIEMDILGETAGIANNNDLTRDKKTHLLHNDTYMEMSRGCMFVGSFGTGKTSTIKSLFGEAFVKKHISTDGIETYGLDVLNWIKRDVISSWVNSLYTHSVPDAYPDTNGIASSKFIIVGAKTDLVEPEVVDKRMDEIITHISRNTPKAFRELYAGKFAITNKGRSDGLSVNNEIPALKNKIQELSIVHKCKHPCAQIRLELALRQMKKQFVQISEVHSIGKKLGLDEDMVEEALKYYHSLLYEEMVDIILEAEDRLDDKEVLLRMYEKFHIICKRPSDNSDQEIYYMPCMLKEKSLDPLIAGRSSPLYYHFEGNFLPDALFHQLVVKCLHTWKDAKLFLNAARFAIDDSETTLKLELFKKGMRHRTGPSVTADRSTDSSHADTPRVDVEVDDTYLSSKVLSDVNSSRACPLEDDVRVINEIHDTEAPITADRCIDSSQRDPLEVGATEATRETSEALSTEEVSVSATRSIYSSRTCPLEVDVTVVNEIRDTEAPITADSIDSSQPDPLEDGATGTIIETLKALSNEEEIKPTIGVVTALDWEHEAMLQMFDAPTNDYEGTQPQGDVNYYKIGKIKGKTVVMTQLPVGLLGENSAAVTVTRLCDVFSTLQIIFMVGTAGGVPNYQYDEASLNNTTAYIRPHVRKGDVIVSYPIEQNGPAFIHFDYGEIISLLAMNNFRENIRREHVGLHQKALNAARECKYDIEKEGPSSSTIVGELIDGAIRKMKEKGKRFQRPAAEEDILPVGHHHPPEPMLRRPGEPKVHFGILGSANSAMRNTEVRDKLAAAANVIGFENENSGVATAAHISSKGCMFVRGVCDYADEHKDGRWHRYAALAAASMSTCIIEKLNM